MSKQLGKRFLGFVFGSKPSLSKDYRELVAASSVTFCILLLRSLGIFEPLEWKALDHFFQLRPEEKPSSRITIVTIDEAAIKEPGSWPIKDEIIADLLNRINRYKPRAIGLDIYRDVPIKPRNEELVQAYKSVPNLIGTELLSANKNIRVFPPKELSQKGKIGFNNILTDADGKTRRALLYWHINNQKHQSFALKLALTYLKSEGITPKRVKNYKDALRLGRAIFRRFQSNDGGYVGENDRGYQILFNFPKPPCPKSEVQIEYCDFNFDRVSFEDLLNSDAPADLLEDRIVLIGYAASSISRPFLIPYSQNSTRAGKRITGIELQAYLISGLIQSAMTGRPQIQVWFKLTEYIFIFFCAYVGAFIKNRTYYSLHCFIGLLCLCLILFAGSYISFIFGWWIPLIPSLFALLGSAVVVTYQIAQIQNELQRSKEFLAQVINSIPDPVYVKNSKYQWVVLNEAFCRLIGRQREELLEKCEYEFLPEDEANIFRQQEELVFYSRQPQEHEEKFTSANQKTHLLATKRSLHRDSAGNFFLVGVVHDITKRKRLEEELKHKAEELSRHNNELKSKENDLRYLAYHDPLTGLPNRKFFTEQLQESVNWAKTSSLLLGLLFIDLDGFKQVNDTFGHELGDSLLSAVSQRLISCLRGSDIVSRLGGDEFTVILRAIPTVEMAATMAQKILAAMNESIIIEGHIIKISASIGISIYPLSAEDSQTLIQQADAAMYRAKELGKNCYRFLEKEEWELSVNEQFQNTDYFYPGGQLSY
ncbi:CHASE2 domain-containing protein [Mastigocoleus sp. MO_188.B34]|uniref:CHASE2 domain-containing protein n=1 Tax=Mastigocoleus sp. MO_188.B34 TaxID=3036635 RepID=UPI00263159AE|nr:CHASE2 domain-containing protein [Mastigocoleus sp. MO_188.B34]MDJ0696670.1 CHASE2 domain-containing protein [Mastigocoleus sp. MO_188.B34]